MDFLPLKIEEKTVYASFWSRLGAALVDVVVLVPIMIGLQYAYGFGAGAAYLAATLSGFLFVAYNIYFNAKYGGTPGKLFLGIRVTRPNGDKISLNQAYLRSSVDIIFTIIFVGVAVYSIYQMSGEAIGISGFIEKSDILSSGEWPNWYDSVDQAESAWIWGELLFMLMNKYKRAIHDLIAGTVVINKEYA